jgi:hypothetical protein
MKIGARWRLLKTAKIPEDHAVFVRGTGTENFDIPETEATIDGDYLYIDPVPVSKALTPELTKYFNPFRITWEIRCEDGEWQPAGTSTNEIYVCLEGVTSQKPTITPYRTVVHLACSNDGATTPLEAARKTWALFAVPGEGPKNVKAWNERDKAYTRDLFYYMEDTLGAESPQNAQCGSPGEGGSAKFLLRQTNGSGQCSAWAMLLYDVWRLNRVTAKYYRADVKGSGPTGIPYYQFWVKKWHFTEPPAHTAPGPYYDFLWIWVDMKDIPINATCGQLTNVWGIPGQGSRAEHKEPSQKGFSNHQFLYYDKLFWDPSYGRIYTSEASFQNKAIAGYGFQNGTDPTTHKPRDGITKATPNVINIKFEPLP